MSIKKTPIAAKKRKENEEKMKFISPVMVYHDLNITKIILKSSSLTVCEAKAKSSTKAFT